MIVDDGVEIDKRLAVFDDKLSLCPKIEFRK
jgi:hypothetical protein